MRFDVDSHKGGSTHNDERKEAARVTVRGRPYSGFPCPIGMPKWLKDNQTNWTGSMKRGRLN